MGRAFRPGANPETMKCQDVELFYETYDQSVKGPKPVREALFTQNILLSNWNFGFGCFFVVFQNLQNVAQKLIKITQNPNVRAFSLSHCIILY